ncbi:MAG: hypothetical protein N3G77_08000 [Nitrososphaeria archaeon]|nr:hypothetical protein [Nitrososphaeria archaeon]
MTFLGVVREENVEDTPKCLVHVILVATGGTENLIKILAERAQYTYLLYTRRHNSLPAVIESMAYLKKIGFRIKVEEYGALLSKHF